MQTRDTLLGFAVLDIGAGTLVPVDGREKATVSSRVAAENLIAGVASPDQSAVLQVVEIRVAPPRYGEQWKPKPSSQARRG
ncbi:MAG: hypothetical protein OXO52_22265 [Rhodospirillales bacterium]|nr:hypothetical protein [Rhodospirillales bacterium]MDE0380753.1 hypothetical protein [Rhodospirillales bacterium]